MLTGTGAFSFQIKTASLFCSFCTTHWKYIKFRFLSNRLSLIYLNKKKKTTVNYRSRYFKELGCSWQKVKYSQAGFSRFVLWVRRAKWKPQTLVHGLLVMVGYCRALRLRDNKRVAQTMIHPSIIHTVYPCSVAQEDWSQSQLTGNSLDRSQVTHGWHIETNNITFTTPVGNFKSIQSTYCTHLWTYCRENMQNPHRKAQNHLAERQEC